MSHKKSFDISAHTEEQIEKIFSEIESSADQLNDYKEIQKLITQSLGGRLILNMKFDPNGDPLTIYRVTRISQEDWFQIDAKSTYSYPPDPPVGRANIKGLPVFYASSDITTAIREMKTKLRAGEEFYVSEWKLIPKKTIYGHCLILNSITQGGKKQFLSEMANNHATQLEQLFYQIPKKVRKGIVHAVRKMGDLFTIPGESKYHITSAYAHDIIYEARKQKAYMPILIYPSVENDHSGINFAIHPELILNEIINLTRIFKLSIPAQTQMPLKEFDKIPILERAIYQNGIFEWQTLKLSWKIGNLENIVIKTESGEFLRGEKVLDFKVGSFNATIRTIIQNELRSDNLSSRLKILADNLDVEDAINYKEREFDEIFILDLPEKTTLNTDSGETTILNILMPVRWSQSYSKKNYS